MYGEFKCDASRATFDQTEHFIRVLAQQGRVWLDADWNEQTAILLHYIQALAADVIGPLGGPEGSFVVSISDNGKDLSISGGHYYVDGMLCENDQESISYSDQRDYPLPENEKMDQILKDTGQSDYVAYLDVWERHVTYIHDRDKYRSIREVALGEADTASRSKLIWQVKLKQISNACKYQPDADVNTNLSNWNEFVKNCIQLEHRGMLSATAKESDDVEPECAIAAESKYRGEGNQLYRVEIHRGGRALNGGGGFEERTEAEYATFKWSRENGSVAFPLSESASVVDGNRDEGKQTLMVMLENLRCCNPPCLSENDWVEVVDDELALQNRAEPLWQVKSIDSADLKVTLERDMPISSPKKEFDIEDHPLLRRWDQKKGDIEENSSKKESDLIEGAIPILESSDNNEIWIPLEKGIKVKFEGGNSDQINVYRTGDYWLIPARTATGDVEWPKAKDNGDTPAFLLPHGIDHHYAPLAIVSINDNKIDSINLGCRTEFKRLIDLK